MQEGCEVFLESGSGATRSEISDPSYNVQSLEEKVGFWMKRTVDSCVVPER